MAWRDKTLPVERRYITHSRGAEACAWHKGLKPRRPWRTKGCSGCVVCGRFWRTPPQARLG
jgi:hypothetical protein